MGYEVKYQEVKKFRNIVFNTMNLWQEALCGLQESFVELAQDSGFEGATGESIVAYIQEIHLPVISHLMQVIVELQTKFLVYEQGLMEIDSSENFEAMQEALEDLEENLKQKKQQFMDLGQEVEAILASIQDIFDQGNPDPSSVEAAYDDVSRDIRQANQRIGEYEEVHSRDGEGVKEYIGSIRSFIEKNIGASAISIDQYGKGSVVDGEVYEELGKVGQASVEYCMINQDIIQKAQERIEIEIAQDLARKREVAGELQIINGAMAAVVGVSAIVLTCGAATPFVGAMAMGAKGVAVSSMVYGAAEVTEGSQEYYYGKTGNIHKKAINGVRDTVFLKNQKAYDIWGYISVTAAGSVCSVAGNVGKAGVGSLGAKKTVSLVVKDFGIELAKDKGSDYAVEKLAQHGVSSAFGRVLFTGLEMYSGKVKGVSGAGNIDDVSEVMGVRKVVDEAGEAAVKRVVREGVSNPNKTLIKEDIVDKDLLLQKPKNSPSPKKWLNNGGSISIDNDSVWTYIHPDGQSVKYTDGFPDFKSAGLVKQEVNIGRFNNYYDDFNKADKLAPNGPRDAINNTWHHNQDGKTMQEVNKEIHKDYTHRGGMSIKKKK